MTLNEFLAVEVMGWEKGELPAPHSGTFYLPDGAESEVAICNWNPTENIEQAMMCLEQFEWFKISGGKQEKLNSCMVGIKIKSGQGYDESLPMAISLAVASATEYKDDNI